MDKLLEIGIKKRNKEITESWNELAKKTRFANGEQFRAWVKGQIGSAPRTEPEELHNYKEEVEIHKDGSQSSNKLVRMSIEESKSPTHLLQAHGYSIEAWELIGAKSSIWNSYSDKSGIMQLYSSKISVKPRKEDFTLETIKQTYAELASTYERPTHQPIVYESGKMLEVSIADLHLGKLAWSGDAGDTYNSQIARDRFFYIINDVVTRTSHMKFEKTLFVWSNDFFHYDTTNNTTTAGTPQHTDLRWSQMYKMGTRMLTEAVDLLSQFAPVETMYVGSNHDKQTSFYATEHLAAWFRNDPNVFVDTDPKIRKYVEYGNTLIQFSHGHAEGKRIGDMMPKEAREAWGRTKQHEVHAGHFHSERVVTKDNGVIVRYLNSPSGTDEWHYEKGYGGGIQAGQSFIWDKKKGLMDVLYTVV